jgi:ketosteroid isomerase-like protein
VSDPGGAEALTHEEVLAEGYAAFNRRDAARLRELMVDDFHWHEADEVPGRKVCNSANEFAAYMQGFDQLWDEFSFELEALEAGAGDTILARVRGRGKGRASPHEFELTIHHVWRFREGKVARMDAYLDPRDAADAARGSASR